MVGRKNPKWEVLLEHNLHECVGIYICASKAVDLAVAADYAGYFFIDCYGVM